MPEDLRLADLEVAHARELAARDAEIAALRAQLSEATAERVAREALQDVGCTATELVLPALTAQLRAELTDGQVVVRVVDDNGRDRVTLEGALTPADVARELKHSPQFSRFFARPG